MPPLHHAEYGTTTFPAARNAERPLFLCLSHLRWDFVWQRPQHLLSRAAERRRVVFFEEPRIADVEAPRLATVLRPGGVTVVTPEIPAGMTPAAVIAAQKALLDRLLAREAVDPAVLSYYSPAAMAFTEHVAADVVVYDCMDELANFKDALARLRDQERRLFARADLVFTGGRSLYEAKKRLHPRIHAFPSSIDKKHFARARNGGLEDPAEQRDLPHPRIGFFGVIDERMDMRLLAHAADLRPDWHFVMVGPVVKIDEAECVRRPNVHWLGARSYRDLPNHLAHWDAGFMPFALNEATRFISPTKTPEFLAAGLPVVSTPIADVVRPYGEAGLVFIANGGADLVAKLETALQRPRTAWLAAVDAALSGMSWDRTWNAMAALVDERLSLSGRMKTARRGTGAMKETARV